MYHTTTSSAYVVEKVETAPNNATLAAAYEAYYDELSAVADNNGIGFDIVEREYYPSSFLGLAYAELIDFDNDGLPELLYFVGDGANNTYAV